MAPSRPSAAVCEDCEHSKSIVQHVLNQTLTLGEAEDGLVPAEHLAELKALIEVAK